MVSGRTLFGVGFIVINVIAYLIMLQTGELIGDVKGISVKNFDLLNISVFLVCISYLLVLFVIFPFFIKIRIPKVNYKHEQLAEARVSWLFCILQLLFIGFNLLNGVNVAGSGNVSTNSIFSIFWVFFPVDLFLVIYYAFYRKSRLFKINIVIAIISAVVRGRADIFVLILFFEISRKIRDKSLPFKKLTMLIFVVLCCYPLITALKFAFRLYLGDGSGGQEFDFIFFQLLSETKEYGYFHAFYSAIEHIIGRLQTVALVSEIARFSNTLLDLFSQGGFYPFWLEGLHGIILDQVLGAPRNVPLGTAFTAVGDFSWKFDVGDWNTNPGLVGWIVLNPLWTGSYIAYITLLCFLTTFFAKLIGNSDMRDDMVWYSWAFYLMPAWLGVFFLFTYTLALFLFIKFTLALFPPIRVMGKVV